MGLKSNMSSSMFLISLFSMISIRLFIVRLINVTPMTMTMLPNYDTILHEKYYDQTKYE